MMRAARRCGARQRETSLCALFHSCAVLLIRLCGFLPLPVELGPAASPRPGYLRSTGLCFSPVPPPPFPGPPMVMASPKLYPSVTSITAAAAR